MKILQSVGEALLPPMDPSRLIELSLQPIPCAPEGQWSSFWRAALDPPQFYDTRIGELEENAEDRRSYFRLRHHLPGSVHTLRARTPVSVEVDNLSENSSLIICAIGTYYRKQPTSVFAYETLPDANLDPRRLARDGVMRYLAGEYSDAETRRLGDLASDYRQEQAASIRRLTRLPGMSDI